MTGPGHEPLFSVGEDPQGEKETTARVAAAANALVEAAEGRLNPVELTAIARSRFEESVRRELLPTLEAPPACRRGCAWCCRSGVRVSIAEAVAVAVWFLTRKTAAEQDEIRKRLDVYVGEASRLAAERRLTFKKPCPFLEGEECTVYPVRPMICAGYLSPTPEACERVARVTGELTLTVRGAAEEAGVLCVALAQMFGAVGLEAELVDLAGAVKIILDDLTSVDRWRSGEKVFASAIVDGPTGETLRLEEENASRYRSALPAFLEELERRAGPEAAAATREAWEKWLSGDPRSGVALPSLTPGR